ncbi:hypothetical protein Bbelb_402680 [Branchiostoma belcheri]|nr:hypothetical protein Bbelb_402680 [Branchiostoma belcheri]
MGLSENVRPSQHLLGNKDNTQSKINSSKVPWVPWLVCGEGGLLKGVPEEASSRSDRIVNGKSKSTESAHLWSYLEVHMNILWQALSSLGPVEPQCASGISSKPTPMDTTITRAVVALEGKLIGQRVYRLFHPREMEAYAIMALFMDPGQGQSQNTELPPYAGALPTTKNQWGTGTHDPVAGKLGTLIAQRTPGVRGADVQSESETESLQCTCFTGYACVDQPAREITVHFERHHAGKIDVSQHLMHRSIKPGQLMSPPTRYLRFLLTADRDVHPKRGLDGLQVDRRPCFMNEILPAPRGRDQ